MSRRFDETGERDLQRIVAAYTETRAEYLKFMDRLDVMTGEDKDGDRRAAGSPPREGIDWEIFEDADEELVDDL